MAHLYAPPKVRAVTHLDVEAAYDWMHLGKHFLMLRRDPGSYRSGTVLVIPGHPIVGV